MYMDLVLAQHEGNEKPYLFKAPGFCHLEAGDEIICETKKGKNKAIVKSCITINTNLEEKAYDMILAAAGATEPLKKVLSKVEYKDFTYTEDE
jgi:hypothetical protein